MEYSLETNLNAENPIIPGCNYHTKWQSHPGMRFILHSTKGEECVLKTRVSKKTINCKVSDLIFIRTKNNFRKAAAKTLKSNQPHENHASHQRE